jgi:molybdopterin-guanine dinucleotide biosynthesis protein A
VNHKNQSKWNIRFPKEDSHQCAVILAGGDSHRMGFDKQELFLNGKRVVFSLIEQLKRIFSPILVITHRPELYVGSGVLTTSDIYQNQGPLGGIHAALSTGLAEYYYVIACDMPVLNNAFIAYMQKQVKMLKPDIICAINGIGWIEPFNAFYSARCLNPLTTYIKKENTALFKFIKTQNTFHIGFEEAKLFSPLFEMFKDVNTFQDLTEYRLSEKVTDKNMENLPVND